MPFNNKNWNQIRYSIYSPFYDIFLRFIRKGRRLSIESARIDKCSKILISGAGTGLDLKFIPAGPEITATDITPAMLRKTYKKNKILKHNLKTITMDSQNLEFPDEHFDIVILHFILAIVPDPKKAFREAVRVLKNNGQIIILDKFIGDGKKASLPRRFLNIITGFLASDINMSFRDIIEDSDQLQVEHDIDTALNGFIRRIKIKKA